MDNQQNCGWPNNETYRADLWANKDEASREYWATQARQAIADFGADNLQAVLSLSQKLKSEYTAEESSRVDWVEIAERSIADITADDSAAI